MCSRRAQMYTNADSYNGDHFVCSIPGFFSERILFGG
jgi:hypothetical protein